jgi:hypothetical protein
VIIYLDEIVQSFFVKFFHLKRTPRLVSPGGRPLPLP